MLRIGLFVQAPSAVTMLLLRDISTFHAHERAQYPEYKYFSCATPGYILRNFYSCTLSPCFFSVFRIPSLSSLFPFPFMPLKIVPLNQLLGLGITESSPKGPETEP